jgi:hypothetical protein
MPAHAVHEPTTVRSPTLLAIAALAGVTIELFACGGRLPQPASATQPPDAFHEVPYPPPPAKVEYVPDPPRKDAVWVNGQWRWLTTDWRWERGGWYAVPAGLGFARWETRREVDGRLLFAPASWRDARGQEAPTPTLLAQATAGPASLELDGGAEVFDASLDASLADAPTMFDGPLFDSAVVREPLLSDAGVASDGGVEGAPPDAGIVP